MNRGLSALLFALDGFMGAFLLLVLCSTLWTAKGLGISATLDKLAGERKSLGLIRLPQDWQKKSPTACTAVPESVCAAEGGGNFPFAFQYYENRITECGMSGWRLVAQLGAGHAAAVSAWVTPCGLPVALKDTRRPYLVPHIQHDCAILQSLSSYLDDPDCNGCFPRFFFFSNATGVCYAQHVMAVPISTYLDHVDAKNPAGLSRILDLFRQGLGILSILQRAGVQHRDLTFRNILVKNTKNADEQHRLLMLDFGGSKSDELGSAPGTVATQLSSCGFSDLHSYACSYLDRFYPGFPYCTEAGKTYCERRVHAVDVVGHVDSFQRFLLSVIGSSQRKAFIADYRQLLIDFQEVKRL
jgi:tRNA A-37 threonylcarbamoyl transferase component Bud32